MISVDLRRFPEAICSHGMGCSDVLGAQKPKNPETREGRPRLMVPRPQTDPENISPRPRHSKPEPENFQN